MGLKVVLEDERGKEIASVEDPTNILHRILPSPEDNSFCYLRQIDWYGDTVFNRLQMVDVYQELQRLANNRKVPEELLLIDQISKLAVQGQNGVHLYLKFYGD